MLTNEEINKKLDQRHIQILSSNSSLTERATFKCLDCNYQWEKPICKILYSGYGCPKCRKPRLITSNLSKKEQIINKLTNLGLCIIGKVL